MLTLPWLSARAQGDSAARALFRSGDSAYAVGARAPAINAYRQAVARDSTGSSRAVYRLAVMLAEEAAFRDAITLHLLYATLEPNDAEGVLGLARTYSWAGRTDDALKIYRVVLAKEPDYEGEMDSQMGMSWSSLSRWLQWQGLPSPLRDRAARRWP